MTKPSVVPHPPLEEYYGEASKREGFVRTIFDDTAPWYDTVGAIVSFGYGDRYRNEALARAGLQRGMKVLDVATGTGVVARAAATLANERDIVTLDPSLGMLLAGRSKKRLTAVQSVGERLPFPSRTFDLLTVGFAMRHLADLRTAFDEWHRVLKPGGRILIMEITPPRSAIGYGLLSFYMGRFVPFLTRIRTGSEEAATLMRYYWDTIRLCVPPATIVATLADAGFVQVKRHVELGVFSEYGGVK
jgi:demethylmenaquinone methyltransferase/2-methoxy-6-polyprenyl-1,4-benzoquinol methylase